MLIRLTKGKDKPHTLACVRDDGTSTWARLNIPPQHDLVHYAVETVLGLESSFYGLLARGWNIPDFEDREARKALEGSPEGVRTEYIVGLLQTELADGAEVEDFNAELRRMCGGRDVPPPEISPEDLRAIRAEVRRLLGLWLRLEPGAALELRFG